MSINLNGLTEKQLLDLNKQIMAKLKEIDNQKALNRISLFKMGDIVSFKHGGRNVEGIIIRLHQKTVTVLEPDQTKWKISPQFLIEVKRPRKRTLSFAQSLFLFPTLKSLNKGLKVKRS